MQTIIVNTLGPIGPKGEPGAPREKLSDYSGSFSYCGYAEEGSPEANNVWTITRITVFGDGNVTTGVATEVNWTDRYTHTYT
jgi:hypothetical protein